MISVLSYFLFIQLFFVAVTSARVAWMALARGAFPERFSLGFGPLFFEAKMGSTRLQLKLVPFWGECEFREGAPPVLSCVFEGISLCLLAGILMWSSSFFAPATGGSEDLRLAPHSMSPYDSFQNQFNSAAFDFWAQAGVSCKDCPAARAGILTGDFIMSVEDRPIQGWHEFLREYQRVSVGGKMRFVIRQREGNDKGIELIKKSEASPAEEWGLHSSVSFVNSYIDTTDSFISAPRIKESGIKPFDRIVGEEGLTSCRRLADRVQAAGEAGETVTLRFERAGQIHSAEITPICLTMRDYSLQQRLFCHSGLMFYGQHVMRRFQWENPGLSGSLSKAGEGFAGVLNGISNVFHQALSHPAGSYRLIASPLLLSFWMQESYRKGLPCFLGFLGQLMFFFAIAWVLARLIGGSFIAAERFLGRRLRLARAAGAVGLLLFLTLGLSNDLIRYREYILYTVRSNTLNDCVK